MRANGGARRLHLSFPRPLVRAAFFIPAVLLLLFLVILPILQTIFLSFYSDGAFVGVDNYSDVVSDPATINLRGFPRGPPLGTLVHNLIWTAIHLPMSLFTGLFLAVLLQRVRGASIVKSMIFVGMVTPMILGGVILRFLFEAPIGLVPSAFGALGFESLNVNWIVHPSTLLFGLIFGSVWLWTGFSLILYSAGLTTIPKDYFEAARVDGASPWRIFRRITWPLLRPITLVVVTMTVLWELKLFDLVLGATNAGGGVGSAADVLALQMYRYGFVALPPRVHQAAAVATLLTGLTLAWTVMMFRHILLGARFSRGKRSGRLARRLAGRA